MILVKVMTLMFEFPVKKVIVMNLGQHCDSDFSHSHDFSHHSA